MADSAELRTETTASHHDGFPMQRWLKRRTVVLNVVRFFFFLDFLLLPPVRTDSSTFTSLRTFITHTSCFFELYNNTVDDVCRWCNTNMKLSTVLSLHSSTRIVKDFDNKHYSETSYTTPSCYSVQRCQRQQTNFLNM